jgi:multicomponent Na+:H+ antiporter subunit E
MSGLFDAWHFGLGVLSCALVSYMSSDLLFSEKPSMVKVKKLFKTVNYFSWLLYQIILSNIYIAKLALHPQMKKKIHPRIVKFRTTLKKDFSIFAFANSITLTPGTITVFIENDCFYVHGIDAAVTDSLPGEMEERIKQTFEGK